MCYLSAIVSPVSSPRGAESAQSGTLVIAVKDIRIAETRTRNSPLQTRVVFNYGLGLSILVINPMRTPNKAKAKETQAEHPPGQQWKSGRNLGGVAFPSL